MQIREFKKQQQKNRILKKSKKTTAFVLKLKCLSNTK